MRVCLERDTWRWLGGGEVEECDQRTECRDMQHFDEKMLPSDESVS